MTLALGTCTHGASAQQAWPGLPQSPRTDTALEGMQRCPAEVVRHSRSRAGSKSIQLLLLTEAAVASQGQLSSQSWPARALVAPSAHGMAVLLESIAKTSSCRASMAGKGTPAAAFTLSLVNLGITCQTH